MTAIVRRRYWERQPVRLSRLDHTHPCAAGAGDARACAYVFTPAGYLAKSGGFGSQSFYDQTKTQNVIDWSGNGHTGTTTGGPGGFVGGATDPQGMCYDFNANPVGAMTTGVTPDTTFTEATVYWGMYTTRSLASGSNNAQIAWGCYDGTNYIGIDQNSITNVCDCVVFNSGATFSFSAWPAGRYFNMALVWKNGTPQTLYQNGAVLPLSGASNVSVVNMGANGDFRVGERGTEVVFSFLGRMFYWYFFPRAHSAGQVALMNANPYRIFPR